MIFLLFPILTGVTQTFTQAPIATTTLPTSTGLPPLDKTVTVDTTEPYSATVSFNRAFHNDLRYVAVVVVLVLLPIYIYGVSIVYGVSMSMVRSQTTDTHKLITFLCIVRN